MNNRAYSTNTSIVTINSVELVPVEYQGERVVTLAMIDKVHERPEGTAGRNFRENRERLVEGRHFFEVTQPDEIRRLGLTRPQGGVPSKVILITERGYLKLTKSLNDDLAWDVQDMLVESYFAKPGHPAQPQRPPRIDVAREHRLAMAHNLRIAKMIGLDGNQAVLSANRATVQMTGIDTLGLMGITHMNAPQNDVLLTPTELGQRLGGLSAQRVNQALCDMGLQHRFPKLGGGFHYEASEDGLRAGGVMQDTGKARSDGTPVRQLKWASSVVPAIEVWLNGGDAA